MTLQTSPTMPMTSVQERITNRAFVHMISMIHLANYSRETKPGDPKVGGHPASCASSMHILSALHLDVRQPQDYVCCKPHASPTDHALHLALGLFRHNKKVDAFASTQRDGWFTREEAELAMGTLRKFPTPELPYVFQSYHAASDPDNFHFLPSGTVGIPPVCSEPIKRPNVLLICIDDLRPELGCYGVPEVQSPQLDAFAETALRFDRHYVQFPTCGASRYSFLTGRRPSQPAHYGNGAFATLHELSEGEEPVATLPAVFHQAGYRTVGLGKISHSHDGRMRSGKDELPDAWDALPTDAGPWGEARHLLHGYANGVPRVAGKSPITESEDVPDDGYPDARLASQAIEELRVLASGEAPFFLAVGFFKPHLPFAAPRSYWDLYDPNNLPRSTQPDIPEDLPSINGLGPEW